MPMLLLAGLLTGCVVITDEEYAERLNHTLSGSAVLPQRMVDREGDLVVGLLPVDLREPLLVTDQSALIVADRINGVAAGEEVGFNLTLGASLDEAWRYSLDGAGAADTLATGMLVAFLDDDGDDLPGEGETLVGAVLGNLIAWVPEDSAALADLGATPGFNLVRLGFTDAGEASAEPVQRTGITLDVSGNLAPLARAELDIRVDPPMIGLQPALDLYNASQYLGGTTPDAPAFIHTTLQRRDESQEVTVGPFDVPPDDHFLRELDVSGVPTSLEDYGLEAAFYAAIAYNDTDRNQEWTGGTLEAPAATSLNAGRDSRMVAYFRPIGFRAVLAAGQVESFGWSLTNGSGSGGVVWSNGLLLDDTNL